MKFTNFLKSSSGADGFERSTGLQILCDSHFNRRHIKDVGSYNYFAYREDLKVTSSHYYDRVMDLCSSPILKEPMGSDKRIYDIFGLTPVDILRMDFETLRDLEDRVSKMRISNEKELMARMKILKGAEKDVR